MIVVTLCTVVCVLYLRLSVRGEENEITRSSPRLLDKPGTHTEPNNTHKYTCHRGVCFSSHANPTFRVEARM